MSEPAAVEFTIRPETEHDHEQIADVVTRAFGSPTEARLVEAIRASPEYIADLALVAVLDGPRPHQVAGHVMISRCLLVGDTGERSIVMLSPLAVDPDHHLRGIGSRLVRTAIGQADELGEPLVVLEGDPRYYSRFGFEPAATHGIVLPVPDWAPLEAGQVLRLSGYDAELRGRVVYPDSFDVLEHHES